MPAVISNRSELLWKEQVAFVHSNQDIYVAPNKAHHVRWKTPARSMHMCQQQQACLVAEQCACHHVIACDETAGTTLSPTFTVYLGWLLLFGLLSGYCWA